MGIILKIKRWMEMIFGNKIKEDFGIEDTTSTEMKQIIKQCSNIYAGHPYWIDQEDHIKTINFAKSICSETARLATLAIGIKVDGSQRAEWLQKQIDDSYYRLRSWVEYGCAFGTIILKPNGEGIDIATPGEFIITDQLNGEIRGIVFVNQIVSSNEKKIYTRLEYHRFLENSEIYEVTNICYVGNSKNDLSKKIDISETPWKTMLEQVQISGLKKPLFAVFKTPHANNIDTTSALSLPIFFDAIEELKDLDVAYSRNAKEIKDSKRIVLLDSDRLMPYDGITSEANNTAKREEMGLPDYIKNVYGDGRETFYEEVNPLLQTDARMVGINALLSQIGYKCGFSNGYFVFNESTGIQTATGVEAEQQRTIQFIKDVRDKLESCIDDLLYALDVFAELYNLSQSGKYEVTYDFGDITYNHEEDRARWYGYVTANKIPFWYYLVKFEGFSEEDAKSIEEQAMPDEPIFFGEE